MMQATASISCNQLTGIWVDNSMMSYVHRNTIERFGQGIAYYNASNNSRIYCNTFNRTWDGLYFNNAVVDDQGYPVGASGYPNGLAADNKWQNHLGPDRTAGFYATGAGPDFYYYRNGGQLSPNVQTGLLSDFIPQFLPASSLQCPGGFTLPWLNFSFGGRSTLFGDIVQGNNYGQYQQELRYHEQNQTDRLFRVDTTWVYQGLPDDTLYSNFYQSFNLTACGKLQDVEVSLSVRDSATAVNHMSMVSPTCVQQQNLKDVYDLFLSKGFNDSLTASDTLFLEALACSDPLINGSASYSAMAMLGKPYFCYGSESRSFLKHEDPVMEVGLDNGFLKVYPNPASDELIIQSDEELKSIELYDFSGRLIHLEDGIEVMIKRIDVSALPSGLYTLRLMIRGQPKSVVLSIIQ